MNLRKAGVPGLRLVQRLMRGSARRSRRSPGRALAIVALVAVVGTSACSFDAADKNDDGTSGQLVVALPFPIAGLDLTGPLSADRSVLTINRQLFDSLTQLDEKSGELKPQLATEWTAVDKNTWKFTLRDGVKFHDGTPLTANDVKATIEVLRQAKTPLSSIFSGVTAVEATDPTTLLVRSSRTLGALPRNVALMGVAPADRVGKKDFFTQPVGSGPFKFESFSEDELKLTANTSYWGGAPGVERLVFRQIPEATARVSALQTGEVDVTWNIPPDLFGNLKSDDSLQTKTVPGFLNYEILVNWKRAPLDKLEVRQALVHAVDAETIIKSVLGGLGTPAKAPLAQTIFGSTELPPMPYDPARAQQLLAQSGAKNVQLTMLLRPQETENQVALAIISQWAKAGINVKPDIKDMAAWTDEYVKLNFDLALTVRPTLTGDADYTLGRLYDSDARRVPCANPDLDKFIRAGAAATDDGERKAAYKEALNYMWTNVCGVFPIDVQEAYAWSSRVSGLNPAPSSIPLFSSVKVGS